MGNRFIRGSAGTKGEFLNTRPDADTIRVSDVKNVETPEHRQKPAPQTPAGKIAGATTGSE
jgi:hypothetical protein